MNREIMFRVYDEKVGEMVDTHMHVFGEAAAFGRVEDWIRKHRDDQYDETVLERLNDMVQMQFTGMYDSTSWDELTEEEKDVWHRHEDDWEGKCIWEGDLVEWGDGEVFEVIIENGHVLLRNSDGKTYLYEDYLPNVTVVGNKFEDPDMVPDDFERDQE